MTQQIPTEHALRAMRLPELWAYLTEVTGEESRAPNKTYLIRRILEGLEAQAATDSPLSEDEAAASGSDTKGERSPDEKTTPEEGVTSGEEEAVLIEETRASSALTGDEPAPVTKEDTDDADEPDDVRAEEPSPDASEPMNRKALLALPVAQLRARYREVVGRPTRSRNEAYLVWKIRQAQRGKVPVGPRRSTTRSSSEHKVLPVRMPVEVVEQLDDARERLGLANRMDLFRRALHTFFLCQDEHEVAALFDPDL